MYIVFSVRNLGKNGNAQIFLNIFFRLNGFDEFKVIDSDKAEKNADGKYDVDLSVPGMTDNGDGYQVVVYSKEDAKKWDIVDPTSVDKENKTMEVALDDGALFSVVADAE